MSAKVHYGAPGSFKTSGAIFDDLVPALRVGRKIVTNINGFGTTVSVDDIYNVLSSNKISFDSRSEIINLSLNSVSDVEKMRIWWHWIDDGVLLFFDEIQVIYPKTWREDREFKKLSIPEHEAERIKRFPIVQKKAFDFQRDSLEKDGVSDYCLLSMLYCFALCRC